MVASTLVDVVSRVLELDDEDEELVELLDVVLRGGGGGGVVLDEVELELLLVSTNGSNKLSNTEVGLK